MGPIIGGWLLEHFSWSSVFFALVPFAAVAAVLVAVAVPTSRDPEAPPADRPGLVLSTAAMAALIYTIIEAPNRGWAAGLSIAGFVAAALLLVAFIAWERQVRVPMLDLALLRNLRFTAASAAVTITFFSLMGFIFVITLYFQFLKGYGPLSTGVRLLPVATLTGITSVLGTRLAVQRGTKLVVAGGMVSLAIGLAWASTSSSSTSYLTIAGSMVFIGSGIGLTSAPATEWIMGAVSTAKAGVGSAVNDATRITGATLGVAVIGSIYASIYASRLADALPAQVPGPIADSAQRSVGTAFGIAAHFDAAGRPALAQGLHEAASNAFFDGFQTSVLVAVAITLAGAVAAAILIPEPAPRDGLRGVGRAQRSAAFAPKALANLRTSAGEPSSRMSRVGSRRRPRGEVRKVAQASCLASTVTTARSSLPRLSSQLPFSARRL